MKNGAYIENGGHSVIDFAPKDVSGVLEHGGVKEHPGGRSLFDLTATLHINADDYLRKLNEISAETDALIEKTERLVMLTSNVSRETASNNRSIIVTDENGEVVAVITGDSLIAHEGYHITVASQESKVIP